MSAPAQKLSPSPASTTARASPTSEKAAVRSAISSASKALRRSGRASVPRSTSPSRSTRSPPMGLQLRVEDMLRGAVAAALTPLKDAGEALDEAAIPPYVDFLAAGGVDGLLALGTTGEGFLLPVEQRRRAAQLFVEAADARLQVAVHCGAQSTWDTVELSAHAADAGADAVAVMAPPYFPLDDAALLAHLAAAARAAAPTPFYVYEFAARSGYAVPVSVLAQLRDAAPNFRGLKVSDTPWERFAPYLLEGLDIFVGPEALIPQGLAAGAAGKAMGGFRQQFSTEAEVRLARESAKLFRELGSPLFDAVDYMFLATSEDGWARLRARAEMQRGLGVPVDEVDPASVRGL